jgi:hypothetical protein
MYASSAYLSVYLFTSEGILPTKQSMELIAPSVTRLPIFACSNFFKSREQYAVFRIVGDSEPESLSMVECKHLLMCVVSSMLTISCLHRCLIGGSILDRHF